MSGSPRRNRKSPRKVGYDYSQSGLYFVTICTYKGELIFGDVIDGNIQLTEVGQIAFACWTTVPQHFENVTIDCFVVMPNHVHAIVVLHGQDVDNTKNDEKDKNTPHKSVGRALSLQDHTTPNRRGVMKNGRFYPAGVESGSLGAIVGSYKSAVTKIANSALDDPPSFLWQKGYHDHIIQDDKSFYTIRNYVLTNPARWDDDKFNW